MNCIKCNGRVFRTDSRDYSNVDLKITECLLCGWDQAIPVRKLSQPNTCEHIGCLSDTTRIVSGRRLCGSDHTSKNKNRVPTEDQEKWASGALATDTSTPVSLI